MQTPFDSNQGKPAARSVFGNFRSANAAASETMDSPSPVPTMPPSVGLAAARAFIYRLLAKAFEYPNAEGWRWLAESSVQAAFLAAAAERKSHPERNVEPVADDRCNLPQKAEALSACFVPAQFEDFLSDYIAVFGHAARGSCPLNEIEYGDLKADPLFQPHRLADLAAFYRAFGMESVPAAAERPDHLSVELEFMSTLAWRHAYALENQFDEERLAACEDAQRRFLREHLGRWAPAFARRLESAVGPGVMQSLASFLQAFVGLECSRFGVQPGSEDLLLRHVDEAGESLCASCGLRNLPPGALTSDGLQREGVS